MKTSLFVIVALTGFLAAQETSNQAEILVAPGQPRIEVPPSPPSQVRRAPRVGKLEADPDNPVTENVEVRLHGSVAEGVEVDLSLVGVGPAFRDVALTSATNSVTCTYLLIPMGDKFKVAYDIIHKTTDVSNVKDMLSTGTVLCELGKPVEIKRNGTKILSLTVSEVKAIE